MAKRDSSFDIDAKRVLTQVMSDEAKADEILYWPSVSLVLTQVRILSPAFS